MTILVTGSNGFIGSYICNRLKHAHEVIGVGTRSESSVSDIQYIQSNIESGDFVTGVINAHGQCDVFIHCAAHISKKNFEDNLLDVKCTGTNHIVQLAKEMNCTTVIHLSSIPVIGTPNDLPISELHFTAPKSLYHISKHSAEYIVNLSSDFGIMPVNLRIPSPIGAGMNEKTILPVLLRQCLLNQPITLLGKGLRKQNYIDVRDISEAVVSCINRQVKGTYNIASDAVISNVDLANLCIEMTGSKSQISFSNTIDPEEKNSWAISIAKAKNEFGFQPQYSLRDSIKTILAYWEQVESK